jgi:soluble P-type ATPase
VEDGRTTVESILTKSEVLAHFRGARTVMVGDGANDAEILREASVGVACALTRPVPRVVMEVADYMVADEEGLCRLLSRL